MKTKYLIIGNSAGGIGAVEAIRKTDKSGSLLMVSDEPYPAYSRPMISKYLAGSRRQEEILFRPEGFYGSHDIELMLGRRVAALAIEERSARLEDGTTIAWEKLLLATGGAPIMPRMKGRQLKGVHSFISLDDAKAIEADLRGVARALIIGGGLIGISAAEALHKRHIDVTIVEAKDRVLNTILDEGAARMAEAVLKQAGVRVITGHTVTEITGAQRTEGVVLENGERVDADLVIIAIGVSPRAELARGTVLKVNRGIVVDRHMATSDPDVYACGDVAEAWDFMLDSQQVIPIWPNAYAGGRVAGCNMSGEPALYSGGTTMNALNYFGMDIVSAGSTVPGEGCEAICRHGNSIYRKVVLCNGRIRGILCIGDVDRAGMLFGLMREQTDVTGFKQALLADDFSLAFFPRQLWEERVRLPSPAQTAA